MGKSITYEEFAAWRAGLTPEVEEALESVLPEAFTCDPCRGAGEVNRYGDTMRCAACGGSGQVAEGEALASLRAAFSRVDEPDEDERVCMTLGADGLLHLVE